MAIQELQLQAEAAFLREKALEQELKTLRATQPVICQTPLGGGRIARALRRFFPALRRRHEVAMLRGCGLLDPQWYRAQYRDVAAAGVEPALHYWQAGAAEARNPGPFFDTAHYLAMYPDIAAGALNPLVHYLRAGWREGRSIRPDMPHSPPAISPVTLPATLPATDPVAQQGGPLVGGGA